MAIDHLMRHTAAIHTISGYTTNAAGRNVPVYAVAVADLPCNVQMAPATLITEYMARDLKVSLTMYYTNASATASITTESRIVWNGSNYHVVGTKEDTQRGVWFRADLEIEQR